eukprot:359745-Chlamydomonas_euryale.AAC.1
MEPCVESYGGPYSGRDSIGALWPRWPAWQSMDVDNAGSHHKVPPLCFGALANAALRRPAANTEIALPPEAIFAANAERVILCGLHQRGSNAQWNHPLRALRALRTD